MVKKFDKAIRKVIHITERVVAVLCVLALICILCLEIYNLVTKPIHQLEADHFLEQMLTVVVGLEFVELILEPTPGNTVNVLLVALARYMVINHDSPWGNISCIVCISLLFAVRHFFVEKNTLSKEQNQEPAEVK